MKKTCIFICLLFFSNQLQAQYVFTKIWDKTIGGTKVDNGGALDSQYWLSRFWHERIRCYILNNGNILIAGTSTSPIGADKTQNVKFNNNEGDVWIVCIDSSNGKILWDKDFGGVGSDIFSGLVRFDKNYLMTITSTTNSNVFGGDFMLTSTYAQNIQCIRTLVFDSTFTKIGERLWSSAGSDRRPTLLPVKNTYMLAFDGLGLYRSDLHDTTCVSSHNGQFPVIVCYDSSGTWQWDKGYGNGWVDSRGRQFMGDIISLPTGGFLFSTFGAAKIGCSVADSSLDDDILVYRIDSIGQVVWQRSFGGNLYEQAFGRILPTTDGNFMLTCRSSSFEGGEVSQPRPDPLNTNPHNYSLWNIKFDDNGNLIWDKRYGSCHNVSEFPTSINTRDGGYLIGATIGDSWNQEDSLPGCDVTEAGRGRADFWLIKLDKDGNKEWDKRWGGSERDGFYDLAQLADGSYIVAGTSYSNTSGDKSEDNRDTSQTLLGNLLTPSTPDYWVIRFRADKVVGMEEMMQENINLQIKPNPVINICTIEAKNILDATLTIYDITGRALLAQPFNLITELDLSKLSGGIYISQLKTKMGSITKGKIVKE